MSFSLIPFLFAAQIWAVYYAARYVNHKIANHRATWIHLLLIVLVIWGATSTFLALKGLYISDAFLSAYPTFWLPFVPVVLLVTMLMFFKGARTATRELIDETPIKWLIGIHTLRILALGTLIKASKGEFSHSFAYWVGIPDMFFGISALVMLGLASRNKVSDLGLLLWNFVGVLVILPGAPLVGQRGLPGAFYAGAETPSMVTLYEFPMVLAPTLVVPLFVALNMFVAIRLLERMVWGQDAFRRVKTAS